MPLVLLGDSVIYIPVPALQAAPQAAIVIGLHADGTADLRCYLGFALGTTDVEKVTQTAGPTSGSFFTPRGTKGAGVLNMPLNDSTDDIVALVDANPFVGVDDNLLIDSEYMTVTDASDPSNVKVTRKAGGSTIAAHEAGATVKIGVELPTVEGASSTKRRSAHAHK